MNPHPAASLHPKTLDTGAIGTADCSDLQYFLHHRTTTAAHPPPYRGVQHCSNRRLHRSGEDMQLVEARRLSSSMPTKVP